MSPVPDDTPLEALPLSTRALHCLLVNDLRTAGEVRALGDPDLLRWPNFGHVSASEVRDVLATGEPARPRGGSKLTIPLDPGMIEKLAARARMGRKTVGRVALELLREGLG
jgi:hypothetical protein